MSNYFTPLHIYIFPILPLLLKSHLLCHFFKQDVITALFMSAPVTMVSFVSYIFSASFTTYFASLSAVSFHAISAWPGAHAMSIIMPSCLSPSICFLIWLIVPWYDVRIQPNVSMKLSVSVRHHTWVITRLVPLVHFLFPRICWLI